MLDFSQKFLLSFRADGTENKQTGKQTKKKQEVSGEIEIGKRPQSVSSDCVVGERLNRIRRIDNPMPGHHHHHQDE